ncbi:MAG: class I SAM-dependent methyltransferase [Spirochaetes bacterium]|nr:class I SAM-dependent methyltransferase [Spirochaetota bacterium]
MKKIKILIKQFIKNLYIHISKFKFSKFKFINNETFAVSNALQDALYNSKDKDENEMINKVESLRKKLNNSKEKIEITDYGAGEKENNLNIEKINFKIIGNLCRKASKPYFWALFIFKLIRNLKPTLCLELGTFIGISGSYIASALKLNNKGKLITIEGNMPFREKAVENFNKLNLNNIVSICGRFQNVLPDILRKNNPIDFAFIDGHHDEHATQDYYRMILPYLSDNAVLVFDDISWSDGMKRAWKNISTDERVKVFFDLRNLGVCIINDKIKNKESFKLKLL